VFIAAVDVPTIAGASASQSALAGTNNTPFASYTLNDPNLGTLPETVVVTDANPGNGSFSDPNAASDGSTASGGTITITGTAAQVQADLRALVFNPAAGQPGSQTQTAFNVRSPTSPP
jgi:hypothetical protein